MSSSTTVSTISISRLQHLQLLPITFSATVPVPLNFYLVNAVLFFSTNTAVHRFGFINCYLFWVFSTCYYVSCPLYKHPFCRRSSAVKLYYRTTVIISRCSCFDYLSHSTVPSPSIFNSKRILFFYKYSCYMIFALSIVISTGFSVPVTSPFHSTNIPLV